MGVLAERDRLDGGPGEEEQPGAGGLHQTFAREEIAEPARTGRSQRAPGDRDAAGETHGARRRHEENLE